MNILLQGEWSTGTVYMDGGRIKIDDQLDGFSWGSHGGPSIRLAYGILVRMLTPLWATRHCEAFSLEFIAPLPQTDFKVTVNLGKWLDARERARHRTRRPR